MFFCASLFFCSLFVPTRRMEPPVGGFHLGVSIKHFSLFPFHSSLFGHLRCHSLFTLHFSFFSHWCFLSFLADCRLPYMDASICYRKLEGLPVASPSAHPRFLGSSHPRFLVSSVIGLLRGGWSLLPEDSMSGGTGEPPCCASI